MSAIARPGLRAARIPALRPLPSHPTRRRASSVIPSSDNTAAAPKAGVSALKKGAKRDPELYILLTIMSGAFGLVGWHFSRNPTSSSSENAVSKAIDSEPWKNGSHAAYQYHPGGDVTRERKDAPSALNEVIIPNVNLPKSLHEKYNKWGKEGW